MGYIPRPQTTASQQEQQRQSYMDQFNNAQYAAIPGVRGPQQPPPPQQQTGTWNGQPINPSADAAVGNPWGMRSLLGQILPGVRADWMNDNLSNQDWQTFLPPNQGMQPGTAQNHMMQVAPQASMSGRYGQQAAALAGLLGSQGARPSDGGLLGSRYPRGFRVPGGGK